MGWLFTVLTGDLNKHRLLSITPAFFAKRKLSNSSSSSKFDACKDAKDAECQNSMIHVVNFIDHHQASGKVAVWQLNVSAHTLCAKKLDSRILEYLVGLQLQVYCNEI